MKKEITKVNPVRTRIFCMKLPIGAIEAIQADAAKNYLTASAVVRAWVLEELTQRGLKWQK
jgi:hypothetical protein